MKIFKKLATLTMALLFACGLGVFAGCDNSGETSTPDSTPSSVTSEETKSYTCYEFAVLNADGTKVGEGYQVQLCIVNENGELGSCLQPIAVVNGICVYNAASITAPAIYEAHVLDASYNTVETKETVRTSADAFGLYEITLAE